METPQNFEPPFSSTHVRFFYMNSYLHCSSWLSLSVSEITPLLIVLLFVMVQVDINLCTVFWKHFAVFLLNPLFFFKLRSELIWKACACTFPFFIHFVIKTLTTY